ncbi:MAG: phenylalanine--tRNA ligase subunit beta [Chitinophagales bacterium]|nr:phenylalanine--tRNA ligase subunit beta [Chitinophagales bacterium]
MKISLNWLKDYLDFQLNTEEIKFLLTDIGLEVEGIELQETIKGGLRGLVVGEVMEVQKHPDADKLNITQVNIGTDSLSQIVCGAPNVAKGQKVIVALPGATLYPTVGDAFTIKNAKIRGVESFGMICAEDEIGLGNGHDGIMVLEEEAPVGLPAATYFDIKEDYLIEIGLTPNRSDANSHFGVARDLKAALNFRNKDSKALCYPTTYHGKTGNTLPIEIALEQPSDCPRYSGVCISGITVKESPDWLKNRLQSIGIRAINNIVDITNYVLFETGQPLHAFDYDKIAGQKIVVRAAKSGEKFITLDGIERTLLGTELMICNEHGPMCIGGVYGGLDAGVSLQTVNIFLESAYFSASSIRKTATMHGLKTDAATHFEKGTDPNATMHVLKRATQLIIDIAGGAVASSFMDIGTTSFDSFQVAVKWEKITSLTGLAIAKEDVIQILGQLDIQISQQDEDTFTALVPPYRVDVRRDVDIIEEVLRIYGFNQVPIPSKINASVNFSKGIEMNAFRNTLANHLVGIGFQEMMANSVSKSKYYHGEHRETLVPLLSSINVELDIMRPTMLWSALEAVGFNINRKNIHCKFFELGKTYLKTDSTYHESESLSLVVSGSQHPTNWRTQEKPADFFYLKSIVQNLLNKLGIENPDILECDEEGLEYSIELSKQRIPLVRIGKVDQKVAKQFDIKQAVFFADIKLEQLLRVYKTVKVKYKEVPKFPSVRRDLALLLEKNTTFAQIQQVANKILKKNLINIDLFDIFTGEKIGTDKKSYAVSFIFQDAEKTLVDKDIDAWMNKLMEHLKTELNAVVR